MKWLPLAAAAFLLLAVPNSIVASDLFEMRVRPVLAKNCYACHGATKMGGLDLTSRKGMLQGGKSGAVLKPGAPEESLLMKAVRQESAALKMPPTGGKLKDAEVEDLARWIREGAVWPEMAASLASEKFWSLQPVGVPAKKSIDAFLPPAASRADRRTLIRRVTYDLTGLPPTPEDVDAFLADKSPDAYVKVVDRLLGSPHFGERWGRHWLDVARYSDDKLAPERDEPRPNSHYYRDWVIQALNQDLPYDTFIKAHLAADLMENRKDLLPALGMYGLSPEFQDDRVDVTTRGFLAMTVACAQCHDHKFDPIPTRDFYALQGVFNNTKLHEYPLAEKAVVEEYDARKKELDAREQQLKDFLKSQSDALADIFANQASVYLEAARGKRPADGLDADLLAKWKKYLEKPNKEHKYLAASTGADEFQKLLLDTNREKKEIDEKNNVTLGGSSKRGDLSQANLASLPRDKFFLWRDFFGGSGVLTFADTKLERFLSGEWKRHCDTLKARIEEAKKALPKQYPFLYGIADKPGEEIQDMKIHIRGNPQNLGDVAPRTFLTALGGKPLKKGSGRLELAESITSKENPLTARVMANRIWQGYFGDGIVKSPSNFGRLGELPSNAALLDYLAWRFMDGGWSMKKLHREIVLSQHYQAASPDRKHRLSAEALRDSILAAAGTLDRAIGGEAMKLDEKNKRRTVYGFVSRRRLDPMLSLFDFPNPNQTSEQRVLTDVPLQRLFLLNSPIVLASCEDMAKRVEKDKDPVTSAYRLLFSRMPTPQERKLADGFLAAKGTLPEYLQVLLSSDEFLYVN